MADLRMDAVGEIDRDRAFRQVDDVAVRREDKDLVREDIDLERLEILARVAELLLQVDHLAQPAHLLINGAARRRAASLLLVFPMRRDAVLGDLMHLERADLDFERIALRHDRRMQRLIAVRLRHGDVVLKPPRDGLPHRVDDAEHTVAVLDRIDEHAHGGEVIDLTDVLVVAFHLFVDAVKMLRTAADLRLDAGLLELCLDLLDGIIDERLALLPLLLDALDEVIVLLRLEVAQAEIFKFPLDIGDAETVRERRVDLDGLFRDAFLLVLAHVLERTHIMQAVGELDHDDADVLRHREEHLAIVLELLLLARLVLDLAELRHAIDEHRDFLAEHLLDLLVRIDGVLHDIMEERRADGHIVDVQLRQDLRDMQGMDDIFLAGNTLLPLMRRVRELVRALDQTDIRLRLIALDRLDDGFDGNRFLVNALHGPIPRFL